MICRSQSLLPHWVSLMGRALRTAILHPRRLLAGPRALINLVCFCGNHFRGWHRHNKPAATWSWIRAPSSKPAPKYQNAVPWRREIDRSEIKTVKSLQIRSARVSRSVLAASVDGKGCDRLQMFVFKDGMSAISMEREHNSLHLRPLPVRTMVPPADASH